MSTLQELPYVRSQVHELVRRLKERVVSQSWRERGQVGKTTCSAGSAQSDLPNHMLVLTTNLRGCWARATVEAADYSLAKNGGDTTYT